MSKPAESHQKAWFVCEKNIYYAEGIKPEDTISSFFYNNLADKVRNLFNFRNRRTPTCRGYDAKLFKISNEWEILEERNPSIFAKLHDICCAKNTLNGERLIFLLKNSQNEPKLDLDYIQAHISAKERGFQSWVVVKWDEFNCFFPDVVMEINSSTKYVDLKHILLKFYDDFISNQQIQLESSVIEDLNLLMESFNGNNVKFIHETKRPQELNSNDEIPSDVNNLILKLDDLIKIHDFKRRVSMSMNEVQRNGKILFLSLNMSHSTENDSMKKEAVSRKDDAPRKVRNLDLPSFPEWYLKSKVNMKVILKRAVGECCEAATAGDRTILIQNLSHTHGRSFDEISNFMSMYLLCKKKIRDFYFNCSNIEEYVHGLDVEHVEILGECAFQCGDYENAKMLANICLQKSSSGPGVGKFLHVFKEKLDQYIKTQYRTGADISVADDFDSQMLERTNFPSSPFDSDIYYTGHEDNIYDVVVDVCVPRKRNVKKIYCFSGPNQSAKTSTLKKIVYLATRFISSGNKHKFDGVIWAEIIEIDQMWKTIYDAVAEVSDKPCEDENSLTEIFSKGCWLLALNFRGSGVHHDNYAIITKLSEIQRKSKKQNNGVSIVMRLPHQYDHNIDIDTYVSKLSKEISYSSMIQNIASIGSWVSGDQIDRIPKYLYFIQQLQEHKNSDEFWDEVHKFQQSRRTSAGGEHYEINSSYPNPRKSYHNGGGSYGDPAKNSYMPTYNSYPTSPNSSVPSNNLYYGSNRSRDLIPQYPLKPPFMPETPFETVMATVYFNDNYDLYTLRYIDEIILRYFRVRQTNVQRIPQNSDYGQNRTYRYETNQEVQYSFTVDSIRVNSEPFTFDEADITSDLRNLLNEERNSDKNLKFKWTSRKSNNTSRPSMHRSSSGHAMDNDFNHFCEDPNFLSHYPVPIPQGNMHRGGRMGGRNGSVPSHLGGHSNGMPRNWNKNNRKNSGSTNKKGRPITKTFRSRQEAVQKRRAEISAILGNKRLVKSDHYLRGENVLFIPTKSPKALDNIVPFVQEIEKHSIPTVIRGSLPLSRKNEYQLKGFLVYLELEDKKQVDFVIAEIYKKKFASAFQKCTPALFKNSTEGDNKQKNNQAKN